MLITKAPHLFAPKDLLKAKNKGYTRLFVSLVSFIIYVLVLMPLLIEVQFPHAGMLLQVGSLGIGSFIIILTYDMIRKFARNQTFLLTMFILMVFGICMGSVANNPVFPLDHSSFGYKFCLSICFAGGVIGTGVCLYFMLIDIFTENHTTSYRLWGAAAIYLVILLFFTAIIGLLQLHFPSGLGTYMDPDVYSYIQCFKFSFYAMAGMDIPFENATELFKNVIAIQSLAANLYIVLLVGRILSK